MFNFLKRRKNADLEITENPDILFDKNISTSDLKVHGIKLMDSIDKIIKENISTTTFEKEPDDILFFDNGTTKFTWKENKVFYESKDGFKEYTLAKRINSVFEFGGVIHMNTGAKYVVQDKIIVGIGVHNAILSPYKKIKKYQIRWLFGKASEINETFEDIDGTLFQTEYIFKKRNMKILFSDWDKDIILINVGLFPYGKQKK